MAKRKLSMSLIVLIVAATTLISGTYAWFLVGGFAELFDLGFDVIEANGGLEIQGSAGKAYKAEGGEEADWGYFLARDNFYAEDLIPEGGKYTPVSSTNGGSFKWIMIEDGYFEDMGTPEKGTHYNDFIIKARSDSAESIDAKMTVTLSGEAMIAARVAVTYNGTTKVYAVDDGGTSAVTGTVPSDTVKDSNGNFIIDGADNENGGSYISAQETENMTPDGDKYKAEIALNGLPNNTTTGAEIRVRIWIEGNDVDCTAVKLAAKNLGVNIKFNSVEA